MGILNCRLLFKNSYGAGEFPKIGAIYAKFTYYNGQTSESRKNVSIAPGGQEYLFGRSSDDQTEECVEKITAVIGYFFEDLSAHAQTAEGSEPHGTCITSGTVELNIPHMLPLNYNEKTKPIDFYFVDRRTLCENHSSWSAETKAMEKLVLNEMKKTTG